MYLKGVRAKTTLQRVRKGITMNKEAFTALAPGVIPVRKGITMNKEAFTTLTLAAEPTLYRVAKSILHQEQDVEDAVQEGILKAYEKRNSLKNTAYFQTWLVRIIINQCYQTLKRRKNTAVLDQAEVIPAQEEESYSDLYMAISRLSPKIRTVVVLYYVEGYSTQEIKEILRIPQGTVKSRLSKARKDLKNLLEEGD